MVPGLSGSACPNSPAHHSARSPTSALHRRHSRTGLPATDVRAPPPEASFSPLRSGAAGFVVAGRAAVAREPAIGPLDRAPLRDGGRSPWSPTCGRWPPSRCRGQRCVRRGAGGSRRRLRRQAGMVGGRPSRRARSTVESWTRTAVRQRPLPHGTRTWPELYPLDWWPLPHARRLWSAIDLRAWWWVRR